MTSNDVIYDKIHFRHDSKWSGRLGPAEGGGMLLCVACVIEMLESDDIASVRKSFALSGISGVLKCSPGALRELLRQDHGVSLRFITSLLEMLHTTEVAVTLEKVEQVLVLLLLELQSDLSFHFVLDQIHRQLSDQLSLKSFIPTFNFLGSLMEAVPNVGQSLVTQYVPLLEHLCSAWLYPDERLKASVLCVWLKLFGAAGGLTAHSLPTAIRDRVCMLLLQTLANASSPQLINKSIGLLWLLVQQGDAVSVLMNTPSNQIMCDDNQNIPISSSQNQEQQSPEQCHLPLILKKLLLSGDDALQVTSTKCIASILAHSPSQYSAAIIKADIPEFLFDRVASTRSDLLLWSVYSCLLLLVEDPLFFSQCHSVYGIESLVRSLKEALQLTDLDVSKQGLLLLAEILERQPPSVHLFPSVPGFVAVLEAVLAGVSTSCLLVATQAVSAASSLFRLNHQSRPVQYRALKLLVESITNRISELPLPSSAHRKNSGSLKKLDPCNLFSRSEGFLLQALVCFQAACRLAEECASEPVLKENTFTAPSKQNQAQESLECLCQCLLSCCDSVWIPIVVRMSECTPNSQMLQFFYSILSSQFTLLPALMPVFANKMASSHFYRLALEHKVLFCAGDRNPHLNASCCGFLQKLSMCLLSQSDTAFASHQHDAEEVENILLHSLPSLSCRLLDWPSLLCESPGLQLCDYKGPRATQYCVVIILHLAMQHGDRLLPDQTVFSSVVWLLCSVQEQGSCTLPPSVLRCALQLLAVTQDKSTSLDGARLNCISKVLSSYQSFSSLYTHHPALLHFICRYQELAHKFGPLVLELWLTRKGHNTGEELTMAEEGQDAGPDTEVMEMLSVLEKYPAVILTLLDMVCTKEASLAERALVVLEGVLCNQQDYVADLCAALMSALLQALQKLSVENVGHGLGQGSTTEVNSLPLVLRLLCVTHARESPPSFYSKMDGMHFKLLYHVCNIAGRLNPNNTESLVPALNYLYCCLNMSPPLCTDRAVSMLLSNSGLIEQLQTVLSSSSAPSLSLSAGPPSALLCCSHLLLSSLITLQHAHSTQVQKSISWSLDAAVQRILLQKRNIDNLLLVSYLKLLQALLNVDLTSRVVSMSTGPGLVGSRPLTVEDGALYPLGSRGAQCLSTVLSGLLLQKHELLLRASVNCLGSLLGFLQRRSPTTAKYVVCQPWSRFCLSCLLSSGESCLLHPAILRLIRLVSCYTHFTCQSNQLLQQGSTAVQWEPDLVQVMDTVERRGVKELSQEATQALGQLLAEIQSGVSHPPPTEELKQRVRSMMESLRPPPPTESCSSSLPSNILYPKVQVIVTHSRSQSALNT
ncbi:LOW QUALITY PROTEIN: meiosis inhibitor protein 1 [Aulostomus maculatus]